MRREATAFSARIREIGLRQAVRERDDAFGLPTRATPSRAVTGIAPVFGSPQWRAHRVGRSQAKGLHAPFERQGRHDTPAIHARPASIVHLGGCPIEPASDHDPDAGAPRRGSSSRCSRTGTVDLHLPVQGGLEVAVDRFSSGNQLYDRELKRRIDARHHPLILGKITGVSGTESAGRYRVAGDLSFHGETRGFEHDMTIEVHDGSSIALKGERVFDIREFRMKPPSMLMLKVYPEVAVRVELHGTTSP